MIDVKTIRHMAVLQVLSGAILIVISVLVIVHLNDVNTSRYDAARDSCRLLTGLVTTAASASPVAERRARTYIRHTPLRDCNKYAHSVIR